MSKKELLELIKQFIAECEMYKAENRRLKSIINGNDFYIYDTEKDAVIFNTDSKGFGSTEWVNKLAEFEAAKLKEEE